jgi:glycogen debranching enzyme
VLESAPSFYSKVNVALQVHRAFERLSVRALRDPLNAHPSKSQHRFSLSVICLVLSAIVLALLSQFSLADAQNQASPLELTRPARPWEFFSAVGTRAGLFGNESGRLEAWVYPLKILREFHLRFLIDGVSLPAESLVRRVIVRPESSTIVYSGDTFSVRETLFVPVHESGAIIFLDVETEQPLDIEASFERDFQLEWPAALGGTFLRWDPTLHAFHFGEETHQFTALVGSPTAIDPHQEYENNYSASYENSFRLGAISKGRETRVIVIGASVQSTEDAEDTYKRLAAGGNNLLGESAEYYENYLANTVSLELPDAQLQKAYDWARVSVAQGIVASPFLGTGLVAGYRTSGRSQRPGFAWYFGRDSLWTSLALNSEGDFATTRTALEFLSKYQRDDGKIPHEIAQGATFVSWFKEYPYAFASADATPLYIIAMNDYVMQSGDVAFAKEKWDSISKAYQFLRSTYDAQGFAQNVGFGHGWVEGGPLFGVKSELYQSGLGLEAIHALANLARLVGKADESKELAQTFDRQKPLLNDVFWSADKNTFAYALGLDGKRVDLPSVLATVPMWFELLDADKTGKMLRTLADEDQESDWGMRIISSRWEKYSGGGYHYGSVWPLFTGWASVGEYRYHREFPAYSNLRANAFLALDGSLGHATEVLSGDYYQPLSTSSPHQIWSAAMVISPLLRGLFGLQADAINHRLDFAPHVPADWTSFAIRNVHVGQAALDFSYRKTVDDITLETKKTGNGDCIVTFSPAVSLRAEVAGVEINGRPVAYHVRSSDVDQHVEVRFSVYGGPNTLRIHLRNDFGVSYSEELPPLGSTSRGLRILSETWAAGRERLELEISGAAGSQYHLGVWNPSEVASVEGGELEKAADGSASVRVALPSNGSQFYPHAKIIFHFIEKRDSAKREKH